jgi:hypothetical protein
VAAVRTRPASHRSATTLALLVSVAHFAAAHLALRALLSNAGRGGGGSMALHVVVALLTFPLFYTPLPALFGGRSHAGLYVAALNALLWGGAVWAVLRRRGRHPTVDARSDRRPH